MSNTFGMSDPTSVAGRINPERKNLWVTMLRMPGLPQTKGVLRRATVEYAEDGDVGMCCLGVACELAIIQGLNLPRTNLSSGAIAYGATSHDAHTNTPEYQILPPEVAKWLGFQGDDLNPNVVPAEMWAQWHGPHDDGRHDGYYEDQQSHALALSELNDAGFTFAQIADVIDYFL